MRKQLLWKVVLSGLFIISSIFLSACDSKREGMEEILAYWSGERFGWYEITDAAGKYRNMIGTREDCTAEIYWTSYRKVLSFQVSNLEEETVFSLIGDYDKDPANENGKAWFNRAEYLDENMPCEINGISDFSGIPNLFVFEGTIGEGEDIMHVSFCLREVGLFWDDLQNYDLSGFNGMTYEQILPESYPEYEAKTIKDHAFEAFKTWMCADWSASVSLYDATGSFTQYEMEEDDFTIMVRSNGPYEINHWIEMGDEKLVLFSKWDETMHALPLTMDILWAGHNAIDYRYPSNLVLAMENDTNGGIFVQITGHIGDTDNGINVSISYTINQAFPE